MEVIRVVVNILFGLILIIHTNFTILILIYALGIYLIIDGALDLFKITTGKPESHRKITNILFGIISILLGLFSFIHPYVTILFIGLVITVRIFIRAVIFIIEARSSIRKIDV